MILKEILSKVLRWENAEYNIEFSNLYFYCENQRCNVSNFHNDLNQALITMREKQEKQEEIQDFYIDHPHIVILNCLYQLYTKRPVLN